MPSEGTRMSKIPPGSFLLLGSAVLIVVMGTLIWGLAFFGGWCAATLTATAVVFLFRDEPDAN